eukprot:TRINITY_DN16945_c0_g1_i1.p1 TRINITY_DN16945_c0_g1~~TRINITY_DN16945_c0_g1_i1.p1  ORF type:complete len:459 (+),score=53.90 TRINITY_DN16945_c0_g1_i1:35-1411(+)
MKLRLQLFVTSGALVVTGLDEVSSRADLCEQGMASGGSCLSVSGGGRMPSSSETLSDDEIRHRLQCPLDEPAAHHALSFWQGGPLVNPHVFTEFCHRSIQNKINAFRVAPLHAFFVYTFRGRVYMSCCVDGGECNKTLSSHLQNRTDIRNAVGLVQDLLTVANLDMTFVLTHGDEPFVSKVFYSNVPIFHPLSSEGFWTIPWPSAYHTKALFAGELDDNITDVAWENRSARVWWRGSFIAPSTALLSTAAFLPRVRLMRIANEHPELFDVGFTSVHGTLSHIQWSRDSVEWTLRQSGAKFKPYAEFRKYAPGYKFVLIVPGVTQATRLFEVLRVGAVPIVVSDPSQEMLFSLLKPWTNFVPVRPDLADLVPSLKKLVVDDNLAKQIAQNAKDLAAQRLRPGDLYCYLLYALRGLQNMTGKLNLTEQQLQRMTYIPSLDLREEYPGFVPLRERIGIEIL